MDKTASYYIEKLRLIPHIEGGAFSETYRSGQLIPPEALNGKYAGYRNASTLIYFLLRYGEFSAFHRIVSDEIWHFYEGATLHIYEITGSGELKVHKLGRRLEEGENFQVIIPGGSWFASRCEVKDAFSLCGCSVAPGFDFTDFELAEKQQLVNTFSAHSSIISEMTR